MIIFWLGLFFFLWILYSKIERFYWLRLWFMLMREFFSARGRRPSFKHAVRAGRTWVYFTPPRAPFFLHLLRFERERNSHQLGVRFVKTVGLGEYKPCVWVCKRWWMDARATETCCERASACVLYSRKHTWRDSNGTARAASLSLSFII